MTSVELVIKDLLSGRIISTSISEQMRYKTNQVPDLIRKARRRYGFNAIDTKMITVFTGSRKRRVAQYRMPAEIIKNLNESNQEKTINNAPSGARNSKQ